MSGLIAGVDIGGTTTHAVLCTSDLRVVVRAEAPTPARDGGAAMIETVLALVHSLLAQTGATLRGIGVGAAGVIDDVGTVVAASDSFTGWVGFAVAEAIRARLAVPAVVDNDVNAFLRGEVYAGTAIGVGHALGITLGTGVGGALWLDGDLYGGVSGAAGEIGHLPGYGDRPCTCGGHGHLETLASGRAIAARYAERIESGRSGRQQRDAGRGGVEGDGVVSARDVAHRAAAGDRVAIAVLNDAARALGRSILTAAGLLGISVVIVGGRVSQAWPLLAPAIDETLRQEPPVSGVPIRLLKARLGSDAVPLGAAAALRLPPISP